MGREKIEHRSENRRTSEGTAAARGTHQHLGSPPCLGVSLTPCTDTPGGGQGGRRTGRADQGRRCRGAAAVQVTGYRRRCGKATDSHAVHTDLRPRGARHPRAAYPYLPSPLQTSCSASVPQLGHRESGFSRPACPAKMSAAPAVAWAAWAAARARVCARWCCDSERLWLKHLPHSAHCAGRSPR